MDDGKIGAVRPPAGSSHGATWWRAIFDDPIVDRVGVPVVFWPRPFIGARPRRIGGAYVGDCARVVLAPVDDSIRYPGEVCLCNVTPGALLFGESWIASGDLIVVDELLARIQQGGVHW